ncbi:MAG: hypothetical protein GY807_12200 [Gammaproteobacteria bacterium]|nr:hypothetical protein [Gammaproteobacteria bacterium]
MNRFVDIKSELPARLLDDSNFSVNELTNKDNTIWSGYFGDLFWNMPNDVAQSVTIDEHTNADSDSELREKLKNIYSLSGDLAQQTHADYRRKFFARETFRGYVSDSEDEKFVATIQDSAGDKYEYIFSNDELPAKQREKIDIGAPIVIHVGYEYRNGTKRNTLKIFLSRYESQKSEFKNKLICSKMHFWNF